MSTYEDYTSVSRVYDQTRHPAGASTIASYILSHQRSVPLEQIRILDAGCGTGNYSHHLLTRHHLTNLTLADHSEGMMERARAKLSPLSPRPTFHLVSLPHLPFPANTFHAVMFNLVLHHLEGNQQDADAPFTNTRAALKSAAACLRPGGLLVVTTVSRRQVYDGTWFTRGLCPDRVLEEVCGKLMPVAEMVREMERLGFHQTHVLVPKYESYMTREEMENLDGPLTPEWRKSVSFYNLMSPGEVSEMEEKVREMKRRNTYQEHVRKRMEVTDDYGQITMLIAVKL